MKYIFELPNSLGDPAARHLLIVLAALALLPFGCRNAPSPTKSADSPPSASAVQVTVNPRGRIILKTSAAEFEILSSGYVRANLLKDGWRLTLDDPAAATPVSGDFIVVSGKEISDFSLDFEHAKVSEAQGKLGSRGKRVEIKARYSSGRESSLRKRWR